MAQVRKSITISAQQEAWLKGQIDSGHYASDSEIIRDLIRKEQKAGATDIDALIDESMSTHAGTMEKLAR